MPITSAEVGFASLAGDRAEAAADAFRKSLELGYRTPTTMYNLACVYARLDQKDAAFDWLFKVVAAAPAGQNPVPVPKAYAPARGTVTLHG